MSESPTAKAVDSSGSTKKSRVRSLLSKFRSFSKRKRGVKSREKVEIGRAQPVFEVELFTPTSSPSDYSGSFITLRTPSISIHSTGNGEVTIDTITAKGQYDEIKASLLSGKLGRAGFGVEGKWCRPGEE